TISKGLVYVNDSLEVYKLEGSNEVLLEDTDYTFKKSTSDAEETILEFDFEKDVNTALVLKYKTVVTETEGQVNNKVELEGTGIEKVEKESEKLNASQFSWAGGEFDPKKGALRVKKVDAEEKDSDDNHVVINNNETTFILEYELNGKRVQFGEEFVTKNGILEIGGLPLRTYYLKEVESPTGYVLSEEEIKFEVTKAYNNNEDNVVKKDFENTKEKIEVTGTKIWVYGPEEKPEIELQLYRNGEAHGEPVTLKNEETKYTWENLDKTDRNGKEYKYTVQEVKAPKNYEKSEEGLTVTNTYVRPKIDITGTKEWIGGPEEKPSIELQLYQNDEPIGEPVKLEHGNTEYTWKDLDETDQDGIKFIYTIKEVETPENYEKSEGGLTVTNQYVSPKTEISVNKKWVDVDANNRPEGGIIVKLLRDGKEYQEVTITSDDNWKHVFTDLDITDRNGKEYEYTVEEVEVDGYKTSIKGDAKEGFIITNTMEWVPMETGKTSVNIEKVWVGKKQDSVTIHLLADGKKVDSIELSEDNNWKYTFTDLPVVNDITDEKVIEYTNE